MATRLSSKRELRRIEMAHKDKPFTSMREEALEFFQTQETSKRRVAVREVVEDEVEALRAELRDVKAQ